MFFFMFFRSAVACSRTIVANRCICGFNAGAASSRSRSTSHPSSSFRICRPNLVSAPPGNRVRNVSRWIVSRHSSWSVFFGPCARGRISSSGSGGTSIKAEFTFLPLSFCFVPFSLSLSLMSLSSFLMFFSLSCFSCFSPPSSLPDAGGVLPSSSASRRSRSFSSRSRRDGSRRPVPSSYSVSSVSFSESEKAARPSVSADNR
mmetsp:Transcript_28015/g.70995  ORF Transcript_28015/g.70995 Transcript_28015/m.70995 type:complete len:203 (+) Transcript_28015:168-776(+)